ncbi:MAG TPA: extracellular solute-binding protein [Devosia sp.]|nr:extracellular solute-binding protein [Devosia sp.]
MAVWTYGEVWPAAAAAFESAWGVPVEPVSVPFPELAAKVMSLYAAGEEVDISMTSPATISTWYDQGFMEPLDGLPGAAEYVADMTPAMRESVHFDGKLVALPFMGAVWAWNYNSELLEKTGAALPTSYEELDEVAAKAKADGISPHPYVWCAISSGEHITFTWYALTWNRGSGMFDEQGKHLLGEGSVARETLRWWAKTFADGLSDPSSLQMSMNQSAQAFATGGHLFRGPTQHYGLQIINDPKQSPIAGKGVLWEGPLGPRTITSPHLLYMTTQTRNKDWAWMLLQAVGGKTKDGEYTMAKQLAQAAGFGPGYQSLVDSDFLESAWSGWMDVTKFRELLANATNSFQVVSAFYEPWYQEWNKKAEVELQKALTGEITADAACDNLIAALPA